VRELGKTLNEAKGEPARGIVESRYNMSEINHMDGITMPSDRAGVTSVANRVPLGVVAAISPWNFPFMTPVRKIIPALAAGNTVVFKPASETPHSAVLLMELFEEAGFPPGVVNLIIGSGGTIGDVISGHPLVRGVTFTGSTDVGLRINALCAKNFAKTQLEMGGKNPGIVAECKNLTLAANTIADAAMQLAGQRCTSVSRAIVLEDQAEEFEELAVKRLQSYKIGSGLDPDVMYGPVINAAAGEKILGYIQGAVKEGATVRCGGSRMTGGEYDKGFFIEPTLVTHVTPKMRIAIDEVFGPVLAVIRVKTFEEAMEVANDTKYGLSSCLFSDNDRYKFTYMQNIESGMAHINHGTVTDGCMPFAGVKGSGIGAPSKGSTGKDFFTQWKMVYVKYM
jgi:aldehyde dehydrogenase (NAD+)